MDFTKLLILFCFNSNFISKLPSGVSSAVSHPSPALWAPFDQPAQLPEFHFPVIKSFANQSHETQIPPGLGTQAEYPNHKVNSGPGLFILSVGKLFID